MKVLAPQSRLALLVYLEGFFSKFLVSFDRELHASYFGAKIRKIELVIKPVEGFKIKVSFFLGHPV